MSDPSLFRPIGDLVDATNALPDVPDDDVRLQEGKVHEVAEGEEREVQQIESLCMNCHEQGITRMLLTSVPYFGNIILMSFRCEHCAFHNTEIQQAGEIQPKGCIYSVHILNHADLQRQLVKSSHCTITIPEITLTIPSSRGQLTTVQGLISDIARDLSINQPVRKVMEPEAWGKIEGIVETLRNCLDDEDEDGFLDKKRVEGAENIRTRKADEKTFQPFTLKLDDPTGNSFVQFLGAGSGSDPQWNLRAYSRTREQNVELGLVAAEEDAATSGPAGGSGNADASGSALPTRAAAEAAIGSIDGSRPGVKELEDGTVVPEEIYTFPGDCSSCGHLIDTLMQRVNIPHFKNIIIMSTNCDHCGYRDNEVKSGAAISDQGKKIILKVEDEEDLARDLLKSETCGLEIPEIDLTLQPGTLGGRFTTLEGLLQQVYDELSTKVFNTGYGGGDSGGERGRFAEFLGSLKAIMAAERPFTLILDDPVSNSYLQNLYAPDDDPNMEIFTYERTHEQNEELGINDMVLTGYENEHPEGEGPGEKKETEA